MNDLFPIEESTPPILTQLRREYENAKIAYDEAWAKGEVHVSIQQNLVRAGRALMAEEQKQLGIL